MKVRKLAVALALAGSMGSNLAYALGLGEAEIKSNLNEPLRAEIGLISPGDLTREEILASLAPERDFQRVGIEPIFFLNEMEFDVIRNDRGQLVLQVTTKRPVREPYLNFLVEVAWPSGRLLREYALLIDPPVFRGPGNEPAPQPAQTAPAVARTQPVRPSAPQAPAQRSNEAPVPAASATYGPVSSTDTLWTIAQRVRPSDDLTPQQVMLALQDANPDAFVRNNINLVREGSILRVPTEAEMRSRSRREAVQQVVAQNQRFQQRNAAPEEMAVNATPERSSDSPVATEAASGSSELRLVAGDSSSAEDGSHGGNMGGSGSGSAESRLAVSLEELDQSRRENDELNSRLEDLQSQLENMQRLIELKNDRLAAMQAESESESQQEPETGAIAGQDAGGLGDDGELAQTSDGAALLSDTADDAGDAGVASVDTGGPLDDDTGPENPSNQFAGSSDTEDTGTENTDTENAGAGETLVSGDSAVAAEPAPSVDDSASDLTPAGIFQEIKDNTTYQLGLGGVGILLLGGLWTLSRRSARREDSFYEQLRQDEGVEGDPLDTNAFASGVTGGTLAATDDESTSESDSYGSDEPAADSSAEPGTDALAEAEVYIAYGRLDQAGQALEAGISQEPSRADLRLKLLEVYADSGNDEAFARQFGELEALEDESAIAQAESLRERLSAQAGAVSIDDLETQLRSDGRSGIPMSDNAMTGAVAAGLAAGANARDGNEESEEDHDDEDLGIEWSLDEPAQADGETDEEATAFDFDSELAAMDEPSVTEPSPGDSFSFDDMQLEESGPDAGEPRSASGLTAEDDDDHKEMALEDSGGKDTDDRLDFTLDDEASDDNLDEDDDRGIDLSDEELDALDLDDEVLQDTESSPALNLGRAAEDSTLEDDLGAIESEQLKEAEGEKSSEQEMDTIPADFDDSFLEELDAELDKVGEDKPGELAGLVPEDELDDLELDVSDEDLALIEEVAGGEDDEPEPDEEPLAYTGEAPAGDESGEALADASDDPLAGDDDEPSAQVGEEDEPDIDDEKVENADPALEIPRLDTEAIAEGENAPDDVDDGLSRDHGRTMPELNESDLGDEENFDFLDGADEAATKLDLAHAYMEMGDVEGARDILGEVALEGDDAQKQEAEDLLKKLS